RTVDAWLEVARGKTVREIEKLVATHKAGDQPDDPPKPHLRPRRVTMELQPEVFAAYRHSTAVLSDDVGHRVGDNELIGTLCGEFLRHRCEDAEDADADADAAVDVGADSVAHKPDASATARALTDQIRAEVRRAEVVSARTKRRANAHGRARYQIAITQCPSCKQAWQSAAGMLVPIDAAAL